MPSTTIPAGWPEFHEELRKIREDPQLTGFALAYAGQDPDLAQDGLDDAFWSLGRVRHPELIRNLRAVVYQSVRNAINRQRNQLADIHRHYDHGESLIPYLCSSVPQRLCS